MHKVKQGEVTYLGILFERYHQEMYWFYLRTTQHKESSEDLVQMLFERVLKYKHTFKGTAKFRTWLYQIAINLKTDYFKQQNRQPYMQQITPLQELLPENDSTAESEEKVALLNKALNQLSIEKKELIILAKYQKCKYEELATIKKTSVSNIKVKVHRVLKELKEKYLTLQAQCCNEL